MGSTLKGEDFTEAGRRLGILKDDILVFGDEEETNVLMDFALYDLRMNGQSAVEAYQELGGLNSTEKDVLQAMRASYSSLFKIEAISVSESILHLRDLLNDRGGIKLIDVAFSQSAVRGLLLFIRLVPFKDIYMTSGISFIFPPDIKIALLKEYEKAVRCSFAHDSEGRFLFFYRMNEISGMAVRYE
jgi:hypothetical protein